MLRAALSRGATVPLRREGVDAAYEIGEYWDKVTQIDVVGFRQDGGTDIGECRWGAVRSAASLAGELQKKIEGSPNPRGASCRAGSLRAGNWG